MLEFPDEPEQPWQPDAEPLQGLELAEHLTRESWRIAVLILHSDVPWIDIILEIESLRQLVEDEQPENLDLFEHLYVSRFHRLREQWRPEDRDCA